LRDSIPIWYIILVKHTDFAAKEKNLWGTWTMKVVPVTWEAPKAPGEGYQRELALAVSWTNQRSVWLFQASLGVASGMSNSERPGVRSSMSQRQSDAGILLAAVLLFLSK
jgi:hypothetical protein